MQFIANPPKIIISIFDSLQLQLGDHTFNQKFTQIFCLEFDTSHPYSCMQVAQTAFPFLDVRLKHVDRGTILRQPGSMLFILGLEKVLTVAVQNGLCNLFFKFMVKNFVAGQKARIHQSGADCQVLLNQGQAVGRSANTVTDVQIQIPKQVEDPLGNLLRQVLVLVAAVEHDVDVGQRVQFGSSVTAQGDHSRTDFSGSREFG